MQWDVRAESVRGALFTCGLAAPDGDQARERALQVIPFDPHFFVVTQVAPRSERGRGGERNGE
jgi:hypothetical protein